MTQTDFFRAKDYLAHVVLVLFLLSLASHCTRGQDPVTIKPDGKEKAGAEMIPFHAE